MKSTQDKEWLTLDEVKEELTIDSDDSFTNKRLTRYIEVAKLWLLGAIDDCNLYDERAKQLALLVIDDLYDRNSYTVKESANIAKLKNTLIMQLTWGDKDSNIQ